MSRSTAAVVALGLLGASGCEWGGGSDATGLLVADARSVDAPRTRDAAADATGIIDATGMIDAPPDGLPISTGHLLLSEVTLAPGGSEFIEIYNPGTQAVDVSDYYLSDNGNYFKLPLGSPTLTGGDFIVRFPAGSSIAAKGVVTVAIGTAAAFTTAFGVAPTYSIADATITHVVITGAPSLTDSGEIAVLFQWDGTSSLVKDVDIVLAGVPTAGNGLVSKSGVTQGAATYATDANTITSQAAAPPAGKSTKRIALEIGHETQTGAGNGITGDDETSEDTKVTWDATFTAPTPGTVPAGL